MPAMVRDTDRAVMNTNSIRVVLVRTEEAGNVGAAARVLKNFGLRHLVLVAPRSARPSEAMKWAHGAEDVLEGAEIVDTLPEALAGCARAWAATRRRGKQRTGGDTPRSVAERMVALAGSGEETAWVFGPESTGLRTEEVAQCSDRVTIPTAPAQPSLNLAQAVAVCAYETHLAGRPLGEARAPRPAPIEDRAALYEHLETALLSIGFLLPHTASSRMLRLKAVLERAGLTAREVRLLRGLARQIGWAGSRTGKDEGGTTRSRSD